MSYYAFYWGYNDNKYANNEKNGGGSKVPNPQFCTDCNQKLILTRLRSCGHFELSFVIIL